MVGTRDGEFGNTEDLAAQVLDELIALRGAHGILTVEKFSSYPALRRVCGGGKLLDAFLLFERELQRYIRQGTRNEVAAALSIAADRETVLDRLEKVLEHFGEEGASRDQRTARRWSDRGMHTIATELVHLADVQVRLGSKLLDIELSGAIESELFLVMWQLTHRYVEERAPLVHIWKYRRDADGEQGQDQTYDLDDVDAPGAIREPYQVKRYTFRMVLPKRSTIDSATSGEVIYRISIEGQDAPLGTVSFMDLSDLRDGLRLRFTTYRTVTTVEVVKGF